MKARANGLNETASPGLDEDEETPAPTRRPQSPACLIQSVQDDLMSIYDLVKHEARLFKYGSGTAPTSA